MYESLSVQYPIYYDAYNLCDLHKRKKIASFNAVMLKTLCKHFGITSVQGQEAGALVTS